ncbi:hypothetical protein GWN91_05035, partial [Candidatus Saccharibacteria bacterium]|nr:hypothetical protein [Candidatus Saccharibacteria bacterium]NIW79021.1 hypothetical protein [Calditrichia bacterium]
LAKAVEEHGFLYSSEFGLSYDDLPFYPYLDDRFSSVLQIPVHPISVGRLHWARHTDSQKIIYYLQVIEKKLNGYEPIFLYHHPGQKRFEIFEKIFQIIHSHNIACMTLGEYAQWWKQRNAIRWKAKMEGDKLTLQSDKNDPTVWVRTVYPDGMVYIAPFAANTEVMQHARPLVRNSQLLCVEPRKLRKYTRQMLVHDLTWRYRKLNQ